MSETHCGRAVIYAGERVFAKRDERLSSRYSCRRSAGGDGETRVRDTVSLRHGGFPRIRRRRRRPNEYRSERSEHQTERRLRERNLKKVGEAPVKYELTGASCHLRTEARVWRRPIKCLLEPLGNRLGCLSFIRHRRVTGN
jgi:hypothetical protein